jgi:hypothetical protein
MAIDHGRFSLRGTFAFFEPPLQPGGLDQRLNQDFSDSLLRFRVLPTRPSPRWYKAGIISQLTPGGQVVERGEVPIDGVIWVPSPICKPYRLGFYRLRAMRGQGVTILIEGYDGPDSDWMPPNGPQTPQSGHLAGLSLSLNYGP